MKDSRLKNDFNYICLHKIQHQTGTQCSVPDEDRLFGRYFTSCISFFAQMKEEKTKTKIVGNKEED